MLGHPAAGHLGREGLRIRFIHHVGPEHGLIHDSGVSSLEPLLPPAHLLVTPVKAERRCEIGEDMTPWADQTLARNCEVGEKVADDALVWVSPTVDYVHRAFDGGVVGRDGAALPVRVIALVRRPCL